VCGERSVSLGKRSCRGWLQFSRCNQRSFLCEFGDRFFKAAPDYEGEAGPWFAEPELPGRSPRGRDPRSSAQGRQEAALQPPPLALFPTTAPEARLKQKGVSLRCLSESRGFFSASTDTYSSSSRSRLAARQPDERSALSPRRLASPRALRVLPVDPLQLPLEVLWFSVRVPALLGAGFRVGRNPFREG